MRHNNDDDNDDEDVDFQLEWLSMCVAQSEELSCPVKPLAKWWAVDNCNS